MVNWLGEGLGSLDLWIGIILGIGIIGVIIRKNIQKIFQKKLDSKIFEQKNGDVVAVNLILSISAFLISSRAYFFNRKMLSDLSATVGCEKTLLYDCRDLIFSTSIPLPVIWFSTAAIMLWLTILLIRDNQDNIASMIGLPVSYGLITLGIFSTIILLNTWRIYGFVLAPYSVMMCGLLIGNGILFRNIQTNSS